MSYQILLYYKYTRVDDPETYPMQPKRHTMEYLREVSHLRPRTNVIGAVTRVRHHCQVYPIFRFGPNA